MLIFIDKTIYDSASLSVSDVLICKFDKFSNYKRGRIKNEEERWFLQKN